MIEPHEECLMKENWGRLDEHLKSIENSIVKYMTRQTEINATQTASLTRIMHKIYGNTGDGMLSDIRSNRQTAESATESVEDSIKQLWRALYVIAAIMVPVLAAAIKSLFWG